MSWIARFRSNCSVDNLRYIELIKTKLNKKESSLVSAKLSNKYLKPGDRVSVVWVGFEKPLPGTFLGYSTPDLGESFERLRVKMDNGFSCMLSGFHPDCVTQLQVESKMADEQELVDYAKPLPQSYREKVAMNAVNSMLNEEKEAIAEHGEIALCPLCCNYKSADEMAETHGNCCRDCDY